MRMTPQPLGKLEQIWSTKPRQAFCQTVDIQNPIQETSPSSLTASLPGDLTR